VEETQTVKHKLKAIAGASTDKSVQIAPKRAGEHVVDAKRSVPDPELKKEHITKRNGRRGRERAEFISNTCRHSSSSGSRDAIWTDSGLRQIGRGRPYLFREGT